MINFGFLFFVETPLPFLVSYSRDIIMHIITGVGGGGDFHAIALGSVGAHFVNFASLGGGGPLCCHCPGEGGGTLC